MLGTPQPIICFFIAVSLGFLVHGSDATECSDLLYKDDYAKCPDYDAVIACLKKVESLNDSQNAIMKLVVQTERKEFEKLQKEDACPALKAKGSCIQNEVQMCTKGAGDELDANTHTCNAVGNIIACLKTLKATCAEVKNLDNEIGFFKDFQIACSSGPQSPALNKCYEDADKCTSQFHVLVEADKFADACAKIPSSVACLNVLPTICNNHVNEVKKDLEESTQQCASGILTGKCNYNAIEKCEAFLIGNMNDDDEVSDDDSENDPCTKVNIEGAKNCMKALQPSCTTPQQLEYFAYVFQEIQDYCSA